MTDKKATAATKTSNGTVYKVVFAGKPDPPAFWSFMAYNFVHLGELPNYILNYCIGRIVRPKIDKSPIYAFDNAKHAVQFLNRMIRVARQSDFALLKCQYSPFTRSIKHPYCGATLNLEENYKSFWQGDQSKYGWSGRTAPQGTILCEWVVPIKQIDIDLVQKALLK